MRLYFDEDSMRNAVASGLRANGHDVLTAAEADRLGLPDSEQLEFAAEQRRIIITSNTGDYARLHWEWIRHERRHHGIIIINRQKLSVGEQLRAIEALAAHYDPDGMAERLEYLTRWLPRE